MTIVIMTTIIKIVIMTTIFCCLPIGNTGKGKRAMKKEVVIEKRTFNDDSGKAVEYNAIVLKITGKEFALHPRKEDKKLLNYLIENELDGETDRMADEADDEDKPF